MQAAPREPEISKDKWVSGLTPLLRGSVVFQPPEVKGQRFLSHFREMRQRLGCFSRPTEKQLLKKKMKIYLEVHGAAKLCYHFLMARSQTLSVKHSRKRHLPPSRLMVALECGSAFGVTPDR